MMATPHLLAGAAIGRALHKRPALAVTAAFSFHFVLDAIPHLDSNDLYGVEGGWSVPEVGIAVADFVFGCVVVLVLTRARSWRTMALWGAFFGIVLDIVGVVPPMGPWFVRWQGSAWLDRFHHGIQPDVDPANLLLGFGTQAIVIVVCAWVLLRRDRGSAQIEGTATCTERDRRV